MWFLLLFSFFLISRGLFYSTAVNVTLSEMFLIISICCVLFTLCRRKKPFSVFRPSIVYIRVLFLVSSIFSTTIGVSEQIYTFFMHFICCRQVRKLATFDSKLLLLITRVCVCAGDEWTENINTNWYVDLFTGFSYRS